SSVLLHSRRGKYLRTTPRHCHAYRINRNHLPHENFPLQLFLLDFALSPPAHKGTGHRNSLVPVLSPRQNETVLSFRRGRHIPIPLHLATDTVCRFGVTASRKIQRLRARKPRQRVAYHLWTKRF